MPTKTSIKKWYAIKQKKAKHWTAYKLTLNQIKKLRKGELKKGYEYKGPYHTFLETLFAIK